MMSEKKPNGEPSFGAHRPNARAETREQHLAKLRRFIARADLALTGPVFAIRDMDDDEEPFPLHVTIEADQRTGAVRGFRFDLPPVSDDELFAAITRCRVFILKSEDNYLPSVVDHLVAVVDENIQLHLKTLHQYVAIRITEKTFGGGSYMSMGVSQPGAPVGSDAMRTDSELAMHYVYGYAVKEDEWRREIVDLYGAESVAVKIAVLSQVSGLMRTVFVVRKQIKLLLDEPDLTTTERR
jgi:hypothetical protein